MELCRHCPHNAWSGRGAESELLREEINEYYANFHVTSDLLELRNLVDTADLIVLCAMMRHESRGLHYSRDYPEPLGEGYDS